MTPVTVQIEENTAAGRFRAVSGKRQGVGRTAGEALDSLLAQEGGAVESSAILIHRFVPDAYFTQEQYDRMQELLGRRATLTPHESEELDALIDAELAATVARTDGLLPNAGS